MCPFCPLLGVAGWLNLRCYHAIAIAEHVFINLRNINAIFCDKIPYLQFLRHKCHIYKFSRQNPVLEIHECLNRRLIIVMSGNQGFAAGVVFHPALPQEVRHHHPVQADILTCK